MTTTIRHVAELPAWFSLEKYEAAAALDTLGWLEQFEARRVIEDMSAHDISAWLIKPVVAEIRSDPCIDPRRNPTFAEFLRGLPSSRLKRGDVDSAGGVQLMSIRHLYQLEALLPAQRREAARAVFDTYSARMDGSRVLEEVKGTIHPAPPEWIDDPIDQSLGRLPRAATMRVDLGLPDKLLFKQFADLIAQLRSDPKRASKGSMHAQDYSSESWLRFGVLPYLDLTLWARESGLTIPNRVMADAIFRPGEGGEEVVRKTTEKKARQVLDRAFQRALASIAADEISEASSAEFVPE